MATKDGSAIIGLHLNARQLKRVQSLCISLGVPRNRLFSAVADTISEEEALELLRRLQIVKQVEREAIREATKQIRLRAAQDGEWIPASDDELHASDSVDM